MSDYWKGSKHHYLEPSDLRLQMVCWIGFLVLILWGLPAVFHCMMGSWC
jgi:hypothetical protein